MEVSVIVPTLKVDHGLLPLLNSLISQKEKPREIIVVYSNIMDNSILREFKDKVIFIEERYGKGANYARNLGVKTAKGDVVAFIDSDCVADREWIGSLKTEIESFGVDAVAGVVETINREKFIPRYIGESLLRLRKFKERKILSNSMGLNIIVTANLAVKRKVLEDIGGFDEEYYRYGSDDIDLVTRLTKNGYKVLLSPLPIVYHRERESFLKLVRRFYEYGKGFSIYRFKHPLTLLSLVITGASYGLLTLHAISGYLIFIGNYLGTALALLYPLSLMTYHFIRMSKDAKFERTLYPLLDYVLSLSSAMGILEMDLRYFVRKLLYGLKSLFRV